MNTQKNWLFCCLNFDYLIYMKTSNYWTLHCIIKIKALIELTRRAELPLSFKAWTASPCITFSTLTSFTWSIMSLTLQNIYNNISIHQIRRLQFLWIWIGSFNMEYPWPFILLKLQIQWNPLIQWPLGQKNLVELTGWLYCWDRLKFHDLRAVLIHRTSHSSYCSCL